MKKLPFILPISLLAAILFTTSFNVWADTTPATAASTIHYLFIQTAPTGTLTAINGQPNTYTLTLHLIHPDVTYFSDRPYRKAGVISIEQYIQNWQAGPDNFKKDTPNADFSGIEHKDLVEKKPLNFPVQLLQVKYDKTANAITYTLRALPGDHVVIPSSAKFHFVSLVIDSSLFACLNCIH